MVGGFSLDSSSDTVFEIILSRWKRRFSRMPCVSTLWRRCAIFVGSGLIISSALGRQRRRARLLADLQRARTPGSNP